MSKRYKSPTPRLICFGGARAQTMAEGLVGIPEQDPDFEYPG